MFDEDSWEPEMMIRVDVRDPDALEASNDLESILDDSMNQMDEHSKNLPPDSGPSRSIDITDRGFLLPCPSSYQPLPKFPDKLR